MARIVEVAFAPGYFISDDGAAYSSWAHSGGGKRRRGPLRRIGSKDQDGYVKVCLRTGGQRIVRPVHALVLEAFVGPCPFGMECRHLNGDRADNRLSNLCWGTQQENSQDMIRHGRSCVGERNAAAVLSDEEARAILYAEGPHPVIAARFCVSRQTVSAIKTRANWKHLA
jgi:hypothetical protein